MKQFPGGSLPALAAVPNEAPETVYRVPAQRSSSVAFPWPGEYVRPRAANTNWLRSPAIIMRGWQPREIGPTSSRQSVWARMAAIVLGAVGRIAAWREEARSRQALLRLDDYALRDIGLGRTSAEYVANLPVRRNDE